MAETEKTPEETQDTIPFFPDHVRTEAWVAAGLVLLALVVAAIGLAHPVGLGDPADPMNTPEHIKPEWYFLGLYQVLKFVPKTLGVLIPVIGVLLLIFWPFIDRKPDASPRARRVRFVAAAVVVVLMIALTLWGELS